MFKTITGRSPPKIKTERKKGKKNKELSSSSRRGLYPPRNVRLRWFQILVSPPQHSSREGGGVRAEEEAGSEIPRLQLVWGRRLPPSPGS